MCFVLYLASERMRPCIPWSEDAPAFHVSDDDPDAERSRRHFGKPFLYYVGSDEGCGCGFQREGDHLCQDSEERERTRENQTRLAAYLQHCLADEDSLELYGCWSGDEDEAEITTERELSLDELLSDSFFFVEGQKITLRR